MPWSYDIDSERRFIQTRFFGVITLEDAESFYRASKADPRFDPMFAELIDLTDADSTQFPTGKIRERADAAPKITARRAIVVSNDLAFGLARMYSTYVDINGGALVNVFRDRAEAMSWLEVPDKSPAHAQRQV